MRLEIALVNDFLQVCSKLGVENVPLNIRDDFYARLIDYVYFYVLSRVNNKEEAEDLTSSIMVKVAKSLKKTCDFKSPKRFFAWLHKLVDRSIIDFRRSRWNLVSMFSDLLKKRKRSDEDVRVSLSEVLIDNKHVGTEQAAIEMLILQETLDKLSESERHLLLLHYYYGYTYDQMARIVDKPAATLRKQVSRILKKLRTMFEDKSIHAGGD